MTMTQLLVTTALATATLLTVSSSARAETDRDHYVGVSANGAAYALYLQTGVAVDGGARLATSSMFARAQLAAGRGFGWSYDDTYTQARVGIESRGCERRVCGGLGLDAGIEHVREIGEMSTATTPIAIPRVTVEFGERLRVRGALELPIQAQSEGVTVGLAALAGVTYGF
jgi:hypothetical protein